MKMPRRRESESSAQRSRESTGLPEMKSRRQREGSASSKSESDMRPLDTQKQRSKKKLANLGRSYSTPAQVPSSSDEQIDMLSPKANGRAMDEGSDSKSEKSSIRGMWKKAFKSLKKDRDKDKDKEEKGDREDKRYSKMNSRQSSVKKGLLKRKDSKEQAPPGNITGDDEQHLANEAIAPETDLDPVFLHLKIAASVTKKVEDA